MAKKAATKKAAAKPADEPEKKAPTHPDWYKPIDWESAVIDLTDYGFGEIVLRDPVLSFVGKELTMAKEAEQGEQSHGNQEIVKLAAEFRSYISGTRLSDQGKGYERLKQCPKDNDKPDAWVTWTKHFQKKPLDRIRLGIQLFVNDVGVEFSKNY